jgi:hypothetical protein
MMHEADEQLSKRLTPEIIHSIVELVPGGWLEGGSSFGSIEEHRAAYVEYLLRRLKAPRDFVEEAKNARALSI